MRAAYSRHPRRYRHATPLVGHISTWDVIVAGRLPDDVLGALVKLVEGEDLHLVHGASVKLNDFSGLMRPSTANWAMLPITGTWRGCTTE